MFDIYSNFFQLRINNQKKFQTTIGGFFSLITIIILVICILSFGDDFFSKTNPKVVIEEGLFMNDTPILNGTEYMNRTFILGVDSMYIEYNKMLITNQRTGMILAKECSSVQISDVGLTRNQYISYFCINLNEFQIPYINIVFQQCSTFSEDAYNYILSSGMSCNRNDANVTIKNVNMYLVVPEIGFKPDLEYPFLLKMSYYPLSFNTLFTTTAKININMNYLDDDNGWMMKNINSTVDIDMSNQYFHYIASEGDNKFPDVSFLIGLGSRYKRYSRSYVKFQEFLAVIGGFMKLILTFLNIGLIYAKNYLIDMHIIQTQFTDKDKDAKFNPPEASINASNQSKQIFKKELLNNFVGLKINQTRDKEQGGEISNRKKESKNITLVKYTKAVILNMFSCKSKNANGEMDTLRKKLKVVEKLQDYDMILQKLNELEVMKKMLFSDTQLLCFEFSEKPNFIFNQENALSRSLSLLVTDEDKKKDNLINKLAKLISEEALTEMDEKLFLMLDDEVKKEVFKKLAK
jgi:hypothetical protein